MPDRNDEELLTFQQLAAYLGVTVRRLRQKVHERKVPRPLRLGGSARWKWKTVREWTSAVETLRRMGVELEEEPIVETEPEDEIGGVEKGN